MALLRSLPNGHHSSASIATDALGAARCRLWPIRVVTPPAGDQDSYLKESDTRVRNAVTFPFSTFMSIRVTSATRRSRNDSAAVSTAFRPASSHDFSLTPTTSTTL